MTNTLSAFDLEILRKAHSSSNSEHPVFAVWITADGKTEFGPVRWSYPAGSDEPDPETLYSVSPFPGAWTIIRESQITAVRASGALVNQNTARRILADRTF